MPKLGKDCKAYYSGTLLDGAGNTPATVGWTLMNNVRDLSLGLEKGEADVTTRGNDGWKATLGTLKEGTINFEMMWETTDPAFTAIQNAYMNDTEVPLAIMDGLIAGSGAEGLASNFSITGFTRNEPLIEGVTVSVVAKPSSHTEWYEVA